LAPSFGRRSMDQSGPGRSEPGAWAVMLVLLPAVVKPTLQDARPGVLTLINAKRNLVACIGIRQASNYEDYTSQLMVVALSAVEKSAIN